MKITDLLNSLAVDLNVDMINKDDVIDYLLNLMMQNNNISDYENFRQDIEVKDMDIEGVTVFYVQDEMIIKPGISVLRAKENDFEKGLPYFMIALPKGDSGEYLELLSSLFKERQFKEQLVNVSNFNTFLDLFTKKEDYDVLAVINNTSNSLVAIEYLENKAREMNISLKIEIDHENILSEEEIKSAKGIIIISNKQVSMARFNGKPVIISKIDDCLNDVEILLKRAIEGKEDIYIHQNRDINYYFKIFYQQLNEGFSKILPILMASGALISVASLIVSYNLFNITALSDNVWLANIYIFGKAIQGMIGILLAGFISQAIAKQAGFVTGIGCGIAMQLNVVYLNDANNPGILGGIIAGFIGGYIVLLLQEWCKNMPEEFDSIKVMIIYPIFSILLAGIFTYVISSTVGTFNHTISSFISEMSLGFKLILGIFIGGLMSIGVKGMVSKVVYIFGISQILEGNFGVMAAIMAGGMAGPLAISFATSFFEHKFTDQEKKLGQEQFISGLMFIKDNNFSSLKNDLNLVIIASTIASSIAGGLSMIYNCSIGVPLGGVFVLPLMAYPLRFIVALLVGSICGGAIYGLWKE